jgi:hypothetical protein
MEPRLPSIPTDTTSPTLTVHERHVAAYCDWLWTPFKGSYTKTAS